MKKFNRHSVRLKDYDYSQTGAYFVTICAQDMSCVFGNVEREEMKLNNMGQIAHTVWQRLPERFPNVELDEFVVMPNHVHGIISIVGAQFIASRETTQVRQWPISQQGAINRAPTLGNMVRVFKAMTTYSIRRSGMPFFSWQRNYYEHVIRDEDDLFQIRQYIQENPLKWDLDPENPNREMELVL